MNKPSEPTIAELERAKAKALAGWQAMRSARFHGASVKECVKLVQDASADWNRLTNYRPLNIINR